MNIFAILNKKKEKVISKKFQSMINGLKIKIGIQSSNDDAQ